MKLIKIDSTLYLDPDKIVSIHYETYSKQDGTEAKRTVIKLDESCNGRIWWVYHPIEQVIESIKNGYKEGPYR